MSLINIALEFKFIFFLFVFTVCSWPKRLKYMTSQHNTIQHTDMNLYGYICISLHYKQAGSYKKGFQKREYFLRAGFYEITCSKQKEY